MKFFFIFPFFLFPFVFVEGEDEKVNFLAKSIEMDKKENLFADSFPSFSNYRFEEDPEEHLRDVWEYFHILHGLEKYVDDYDVWKYESGRGSTSKISLGSKGLRFKMSF